MAIASGKHHHFGRNLRSTLCEIVELCVYLRNAGIGRDHDIAQSIASVRTAALHSQPNPGSTSS
jgi:hypothetical protein